ncbi:MAG: glycosyltransferase family 4 protein [Pseudomonadota bacterium]
MTGRRIVIVNDFSVARGGATGLAVLSAELLAAAGEEVVFLSGDDGGAPRLEEAGVRSIGLGGAPLLGRSKASALIGGLWNARAARFLSRWIAAEGRPGDVYHLHGWSKILSPAVFAALRPVRASLVVHAHDFFLACPNGAFWHYGADAVCMRRPLSAACLGAACDRRSMGQKAWRVGRHMLRQAAFAFDTTGPEVLLIHHAMEPFLVRSGFASERLTVLPNPVAPATALPVAAAENSGIVFVGRLDPEKGALAAAEAAAAAGVALTLVGEGPERAAIERAATPGAPPPKITGWLDRAAVTATIRQARALVMPSRYPEPFGLVAVEALREGVPVILPRHALLAGDIEAAHAGMAYDAGAAGALEAALRHVAQEDAPVAKMSAAAPAAAERLASTPEGWRDGLLAAYDRALSRAHGTAEASLVVAG